MRSGPERHRRHRRELPLRRLEVQLPVLVVPQRRLVLRGRHDALLQQKAAYGFPAFSGRYVGSPHVGLGLATGARDYTLGWRLTPAANDNTPDLSLGVKGTRRESDIAEPVHDVRLEATMRW